MADVEKEEAPDVEKEDAPPKEEETAAEAKPAEDAKPATPDAKIEIIPFIPHTEMPDMKEAKEVVYCPRCGFPPDFCNYGPSWDACKPFALEHYPQFYPELAGMSLEDAKKAAEAASAAKSKEKILPGGKKKRDVSPGIQIRKLNRSGKKCVTTVTGLDSFGYKLDAACKIFKKKFACGASVVASAAANQPDEIDIQGDFEDVIEDVICENFPKVDLDKIDFLDGGTKKGGKRK